MAYQTPPSKLRAMPVKTKGASKTGSEKKTIPSKTTTKLDKFPKTKVEVALVGSVHVEQLLGRERHESARAKQDLGTR